MLDTKVALVTGAAKRVGAAIVRDLHAHQMRVIIHYRRAHLDAQPLCDELNQIRAHSAISIQADLCNPIERTALIKQAIEAWGRLDVLINNASYFEPNQLEHTSLEQWHTTLESNLTAPFFLSQASAPYLRKTTGCILNLVDIRANQPLPNYSAYCISKAGLVMMTKSLAKEWAPDIRVNAIAPGVVLWPDDYTEQEEPLKKSIIARTPLKRAGTPEDIVKAAWFLIDQAPYITGHTITVDGGRSLAY